VATSTPSAIQQWIALVKPEFDHHVPGFDHEYLNLTTRSTEILVPIPGPNRCGIYMSVTECPLDLLQSCSRGGGGE
jgi:hypothetical protein